jgi:beta-lactamase class A
MFSKKLLIPLLSLSLLVTPAYSSHAAENAEAAGTSVEGQGMLSPSSSSESSESVFNGSGAGTSSEPVTNEKLETILKQVQSQLPAENGTWAVFISDLVNGTEGSLNDQKMQAASLIKLYIMGAVYEDYDSLSTTYGKETLDNNLNSMITVSDNDAANKLVNCLGGGDDAAGMARVNKFCQDHGYTNTSMGRLLLADNSNGDNYTSVKDCGKFLKTIYQMDKGSAAEDTLAGAEYMYHLLKMQTRTNKIPAQLPEGVKVANKTGELDTVENDAGIIYDTAKGIDLVICFMSQDLNDTAAAQNTIAQDSRAIYGYYNE